MEKTNETTCPRCGGSGQLYTPPGPESYAGRYDACPDCNTQAHQIAALVAALKAAGPEIRCLYHQATGKTKIEGGVREVLDQMAAALARVEGDQT